MWKFKFINVVFFASIILTYACKNIEGSTSQYKAESAIVETIQEQSYTNIPTWKFLFDLDKPEKCILPHKLVEISALTIELTSNTIYTVNDEKALIYTLKECEIEGEFDFGKNGDYEGIELVNDKLFVLKSSGKIIEYGLSSMKVKRIIDTPLKSNNDTEGLGFDKDKNHLLIACKGSPNIHKHQKHKKSKAVYSYSLENETFIDEPLFVINDKEIEAFFKDNIKGELSKKENKHKLNRALKFSPSAISLNPFDNCYYLLSTVGKTLMIINENYEIVGLEFLDHSFFLQPEGLCFNSKGEMLISNEGKGLVANILKFTPRKT